VKKKKASSPLSSPIKGEEAMSSKLDHYISSGLKA